MKRIIFLFLVLGILVISGCKEKCDSGLYTNDGKCCAYVCDINCENGYKKGTCNCECNEQTGEDINIGDIASDDTNIEDINLDDIFDDAEDIEPPATPI